MMVTSIVIPEVPPVELVTDANAAFRAELLQLVGRIGLDPDTAVLFVESCSGHPFEACSPAELVPFLRDLLALAQRTSHTSGGPACDA
jgi:hypothetical protein